MSRDFIREQEIADDDTDTDTHTNSKKKERRKDAILKGNKDGSVIPGRNGAVPKVSTFIYC